MRQRDNPFQAPVGGTNPRAVYFQDELEVGAGPHPGLTPLGVVGLQALRAEWLPWVGANTPSSVGWQDAAAQRAGLVVEAPIVGGPSGEGWGGQLVSMLGRVPTTTWAAYLYARVGLLWAGFPGFQRQHAAIIVSCEDILAGDFPFDATGVAVRDPGGEVFSVFNGAYASSSGPPVMSHTIEETVLELSVYVRYIMFFDANEDETTVLPQVSRDGLGWFNLAIKTYPGNLRYIGFGASGFREMGSDPDNGTAWLDYLRLERIEPNEQIILTTALTKTNGGRNYPQ